jgi:hypothetical protein
VSEKEFVSKSIAIIFSGRFNLPLTKQLPDQLFFVFETTQTIHMLEDIWVDVLFGRYYVRLKIKIERLSECSQNLAIDKEEN